MSAAELRTFVPQGAAPADLVFPYFPSYDALMADLKRAGVERRDAMGRVVHFHLFRKTWQTMGVGAGISQRVAQEVLGHSDPALTANVYTDMAAVGMQGESRTDFDSKQCDGRIECRRSAGLPRGVVIKALFKIDRSTNVDDPRFEPQEIYDRHAPRQARGHSTRFGHQCIHAIRVCRPQDLECSRPHMTGLQKRYPAISIPGSSQQVQTLSVAPDQSFLLCARPPLELGFAGDR